MVNNHSSFPEATSLQTSFELGNDAALLTLEPVFCLELLAYVLVASLSYPPEGEADNLLV